MGRAPALRPRGPGPVPAAAAAGGKQRLPALPRPGGSGLPAGTVPTATGTQALPDFVTVGFSATSLTGLVKLYDILVSVSMSHLIQ